MKLYKHLIIFNVLISIPGCGPNDPPKTKLFEEQRNALDKAKEVEGKVKLQAQEMQKSMEKQTQ